MIQTKIELRQISSILSYAFNVEKVEITGIKDTEYKFWACYLARKVTNYSYKEIAAFFQIDPIYMKTKLEQISIGFLFNLGASAEMERLCCLYLELKINES